MSAPLKPCPFCGDAALIGQTLDDDYYVSCVNDECKGNVGYFLLEEDAVVAWQSRTPLHENVKLESLA